MNWSTAVKVARYHLADRFTFVAAPLLVQAFTFAVNLMIFVGAPVPGPGRASYSGALGAIYVAFAVLGARSISRRLPFALAIGVSRRSFYAGTALLAGALAAVDGLILALLQPAESATGGWGLRLDFFRVPYLLDGPWYLTWLTSLVGLALMFAWGMWFGLIFRRWNWAGLAAFAAVQIAALGAGLGIAARTDAWHGVGRFFTDLTIAGLTGALAVLAVAMLAGGYTTIRRLAI
ncbi:MAG TPA: hypothetical protein VGI31_01905 [Streptosporangiaceae bacterium]